MSPGASAREDLDRVLVADVVGALDRVVGVDLGVVLGRVAERRVDASLGRAGVRARRVELRDHRDVGAGVVGLDRGAHASAARADDEHVVLRDHVSDASERERATPGEPSFVDARAAADRFLASPALSEATRRAYRGDVGEFCTWLDERGTSLDAVDVRVLADYVAWLGGARRGRKLAPATISRKLAAVRAFLRHALGPERVPDARLAPRRARRLPDAPAAAEIERTLEALEGDGPIALRNRALVELVYSAGLRSAEAVGLDLGDVDFEQELVHVRRGKGGKERVVPLGEEAAALARPLPARGPARARARRERRVLPLRARSPPRHEHAAADRPAPAPAETRVRDASARRRSRPAHDPGAARPQLPLDDAGLQPCRPAPPAPRVRPLASPLARKNAAMRVSAKVDYALRAMAELAAAPPGLTTAEQLASAQHIPPKFLESILAQLRSGGLVASQRGAEGGYQLARPAEEISVADVIRELEGPIATVRGVRPDELAYEGAAAGLRDVWLELRTQIRGVLEQTTLADLAATQQRKLTVRNLFGLAASPRLW